MNCKSCGTTLPESAKFCGTCGTKKETKQKAIIKCGNCGYIGEGKPARSMAAKVLAWMVVFFAPLITIIYFLATSKYRCPQCGSTFLGLKDKEGNFTKGQRSSRVVLIIVLVVVGIAVLGIISAVVLASLNTARTKGNDAAIQADLSTIMAAAEVYYAGAGRNSYGYSKYGTASSCLGGMFSDEFIAQSIASADNANGEGEVYCVASGTSYLVQADLVGGGSWCIDSTGLSKKEIKVTSPSSPLGNRCP